MSEKHIFFTVEASVYRLVFRCDAVPSEAETMSPLNMCDVSAGRAGRNKD